MNKNVIKLENGDFYVQYGTPEVEPTLTQSEDFIIGKLYQDIYGVSPGYTPSVMRFVGPDERGRMLFRYVSGPDMYSKIADLIYFAPGTTMYTVIGETYK